MVTFLKKWPLFLKNVTFLGQIFDFFRKKDLHVVERFTVDTIHKKNFEKVFIQKSRYIFKKFTFRKFLENFSKMIFLTA